MSLITYPQESGQVAVIYPSGDVKNAIKDVPTGLPYKIVDSLDMDIEYFDAYEFNQATGADLNIDKAKNVHLNKFRSARIPKFSALDLEFIKAIEQSDVKKQAEITAQKQALRDVTKTPLPNTLPEIKAVWPDILK